MIDTARVVYADYPLRSFERQLARLELEGLGARIVKRASAHCLIDIDSASVGHLADRLAFFHGIELTQDSIRTLQRDLDVSAAVARGLFSSSMSVENALSGFTNAKNGHRAVVHSYATHGLHQYKGKYYPQIVRALLNYAGTEKGAVVLDPFVGSGTTTLEAALSGIGSVGVDLNPLATFIARTKFESLAIEPERLDRLVAAVSQHLTSPSNARGSLPNDDYLNRWFDAATHTRLAGLIGAIQKASTQQDELNLCTVVLSNSIIGWSMQMPGQLRVRRRKTPPDTSNMFAEYVGRLDRATAAVVVYNALRERNDLQLVPPIVHTADARTLSSIGDSLLKPGNVDTVITSPPYATALPYLDTDRLSLYLLDLMSPGERRRTDEEMIGNREISEKRRRALEDEMADYDRLPKPVQRFLMDVLRANRTGNVGFRRRNTAALLYKYFIDMREVFSECLKSLKAGGRMAVVVGNSRTLLGGHEDREIPTDRFLELIGKSVGFESELKMPMTDQATYMAHSRNGIRNETIFVLKKPKT